MMKTFKRMVFATLVCLPLAAAAQTPGNTGTVTGTVKLVKKVTKKAPAKVTKDNAACGKTSPDETYVIGKGNTLANVVIVIEGVKGGKKAPVSSGVIENKGCRYVPHVIALSTNATLDVRNSDSVLHTTHVWKDEETLVNIALPMKGAKGKQKLESAGIYKFSCDAGHTWMSAVAYVTNSPYVVVSDAAGGFKLGELPPGTYTVKAWHEALGEKTAQVTVAAGGTATVELSY